MFRGSLAFLLTAVFLVACGPPPDPNGGGGGGAGGGSGGGSNGGGTGGGGSGGGGGGTSCGGDTWTNYASTWFHDNCANCHSSEFGSYLAVTQSKSSIDGRIAASSMPPGGLDTGDRQRILSWFSCDMPQ